MFPRNEEDVAKAETGKVPRLLHHLWHGEGGPEDGIVAREAAVGAVVDTLVREIDRREEPHRAAEMAARRGDRICGELLEHGGRHRIEERPESREERRERRPGIELVEGGDKRHSVSRYLRLARRQRFIPVKMGVSAGERPGSEGRRKTLEKKRCQTSRAPLINQESENPFSTISHHSNGRRIYRRES